jgi:hypothetical protein
MAPTARVHPCQVPGDMQEHLVLCIDAPSRLYAQVGDSRFRSVIRRELATLPGLSPTDVPFMVAECAHRAWMASYIGASWSSLLLVVAATNAGVAHAGLPQVLATAPWQVVLVPEGCSLREDAGRSSTARPGAVSAGAGRLRDESGIRSPWPDRGPGVSTVPRRAGAGRR